MTLAQVSAAAPTAAPSPASTNSASIIHLYRSIWRFAAGARRQYVAAMALLAGTSLVKLCIPLLAGRAINAIQLGDKGSMKHAGLFIAGVFGLQLCAWMLHGPGRVMERKVGMRVRAAAADTFYTKLIGLPLSWHETHHHGDLQHRAQLATRALHDFTQNQYIYLQNTINLIGPLVALSLLSPSTGTVAVTGCLLLGCMILRFDRRMMQLAREETAAERRYATGLLDFLGNISTVISLKAGPASRRLVSQRLRSVFGPLGKVILLNEAKWCALDLSCVGLTWTLVTVYAWQSHRASAAGPALMLGSIFMVYQYAQQSASAINSMAVHFQNLTRSKTDLAGADLILNAEPRPASTATIKSDWNRIEARALTFRHAKHDGHDALEDAAFTFEDAAFTLNRGERVALIGSSGSGKSTLLRLIAGLYEPQHGYYSVDGEPLFGARHLSGIATLIPQEADVFDASVLENLTFGADCSTASIERAMHIAAFDSVLAALPQGLDTAISERGFNLSGGQRQRLALARGLLASQAHGSSIVLLDEPTSALDQVTESHVFERLRDALPDLCVVAAIHRLSALAHFDKVVLMSEGRIVDCGAPDELAERQPLFREMLREAASHEVREPQQRVAG